MRNKSLLSNINPRNFSSFTTGMPILLMVKEGSLWIRRRLQKLLFCF
jgi:hypothetical protein